MAPKTNVLPLDDDGSTLENLVPRDGLEPPFQRSERCVLPLDERGITQCGRSGRGRTFIFLVNSEAHCLYATDRKKASDLRPEALLQKVLKKVRLHGASLTRFDRNGYGLGKNANCSQMFHVETGYSQITSYLSTTSYDLLVNY